MKYVPLGGKVMNGGPVIWRSQGSNIATYMRIAVAGGTGVVGRHTVARIAELGHESVVISRSRGIDLVSGSGLYDALKGCDKVIDVSNGGVAGKQAAERFFTLATRHLADASREAGVSHLVALSMVGIDRIPYGYFMGKRRQEEIVLGSAVPGSVLRSTHFHEFPGQLLGRVPDGPVALIPMIKSQPVAAKEVAEALVDLALGEPVGRAPDLAGPEVEDVPDMAKRLVKALGKDKRVIPMKLPGEIGEAFATGQALPEGSGPRGKQTFEQWLGLTGSGTSGATGSGSVSP